MVIMRTEQPTKCFVPLRRLGAGLAPWDMFKPPPPTRGSLLAVRGGGFVVVLCYLFWCQVFGGVSPCACPYCFSSVLVAEGPLFGK